MENPNTYIAQQWLFAGILLVLTLGLATTMAFLPEIIGKVLRVQRPNAVKLQSYECGFTPVGQARVRFSIKFYLVAMLFILFDIEAIFLYPWAAVHRWLGVFGMIEMGIFVLILLVGYVYIWKRGAFQWES
jgi:NADH-quinone oxidoreductase subunit A